MGSKTIADHTIPLFATHYHCIKLSSMLPSAMFIYNMCTFIDNDNDISAYTSLQLLRLVFSYNNIRRQLQTAGLRQAKGELNLASDNSSPVTDREWNK